MITTHPTEDGSSQCDRILNRLQVMPAAWVSMPELARVSGSFNVHSRIADLRKRGIRIEQKSEQIQKKVFSFYRLAPDSVEVGQ